MISSLVDSWGLGPLPQVAKRDNSLSAARRCQQAAKGQAAGRTERRAAPLDLSNKHFGISLLKCRV